MYHHLFLCPVKVHCCRRPAGVLYTRTSSFMWSTRDVSYTHPSSRIPVHANSWPTTPAVNRPTSPRHTQAKTLYILHLWIAFFLWRALFTPASFLISAGIFCSCHQIVYSVTILQSRTRLIDTQLLGASRKPVPTSHWNSWHWQVATSILNFKPTVSDFLSKWW